MKKSILILCVLAVLMSVKPALAQTTSPSFTGAKATFEHYHALYVINSSDEKKIAGTLKNISNALEDPRLKGKLEIGLIAFGDGVTVYKKSAPFEQTLKSLQAKGVILAQCENTMRERKIDKK